MLIDKLREGLPFSSELRKSAIYFLRNREDADDALQELYVQVFSQLSRNPEKEITNEKGFLFAALRRICNRMNKKNHREPTIGLVNHD